MSLTYGFYNSLNGDRKYNTEQISRLFDGIIRDGIFHSIGTALFVTAYSGLTVHVGIGRAWYHHTWTNNDSILPKTLGASDVLLDRIDAIVLEINSTESARANDIKIVKGIPASSPVRPKMINTDFIHQHALCYIYRTAGSTEILQADMTNVIGTDETPFVTGILETISIDQLIPQWQSQLDVFVAGEEADIEAWYVTMQNTMNSISSEISTFTAEQQAEILVWFNNIKGQISTDAAVNLQLQISKMSDNGKVYFDHYDENGVLDPANTYLHWTTES